MAAGAEVRHHAVRHRDDARAARREGLHHRRPGHRRLDHARRSRHGLDRRQGQGFSRPALARARGHRRARPQAPRGPADRRSDRRAAGRRAGRRRRHGARVPVPMLGHVTSSYFSANLKRSIALALVQNGRNRMGEKVRVSMPGGSAVAAAITEADVPRSRRGAAECLSRSSAKVRSRASTSRRARPVATGAAGLIVREHAFLGHLNLRGDPQRPAFRRRRRRRHGRRPADRPEHPRRRERRHHVLARSRRMADRHAGRSPGGHRAPAAAGAREAALRASPT